MFMVSKGVLLNSKKGPLNRTSLFRNNDDMSLAVYFWHLGRWLFLQFRVIFCNFPYSKSLYEVP